MTKTVDLFSLQEELREELKKKVDVVGNSIVRKTTCMSYPNWQHDCCKLSEPTENIVAWQKFLPTGPITLLPILSVRLYGL
ncbi:hypothetical protein CAJAP_10931 [Camponotus japonicus]